jgi:hypothetical protein
VGTVRFQLDVFSVELPRWVALTATQNLFLGAIVSFAVQDKIKRTPQNETTK